METFSSIDAKNYSKVSFMQVCETCKMLNFDDQKLIQLIQAYYIVFVVLGIISLLGNCITFVHELKYTIRQKIGLQEKTGHLYHIIVLNLSIANSLMGIYLIICSLAIAKLDQVNSNLCNAMGVISTLSIQTSASFLTIITAYRLYGVLYPFKTVSIRFTVFLFVLIWLVWFILSALPLFNKTLFAHEFTRNIRYFDKNKTLLSIDISTVTKAVQKLALAVNATDPTLGQVLYAISKYESNEVAVQLSKSLNLLAFQRNEMNFVEYYFPNFGCTMTIFNVARNDTVTYYSLCFLISNFAGYIFIIFANLVILKKISLVRLTNFLPRFGTNNCFKTNKQYRAEKIKAENNQIYQRIFIIVITDLIFAVYRSAYLDLHIILIH